MLDIITLQSIAKSFKSSSALISGGTGALFGSLFGSVGVLLGFFVGLLTTPKSPLTKVPVIKCPKCNYTYRYWAVLVVFSIVLIALMDGHIMEVLRTVIRDTMMIKASPDEVFSFLSGLRLDVAKVSKTIKDYRMVVFTTGVSLFSFGEN